MSLFLTTLNQMGILALFVIVGFTMAKLKLLPENSNKTLSRLENNVFLPALILYTFIENFNMAALTDSWKILLFSLITELIVIPIAFFSSRLASKDGFIRKMYTYGLSFSNFGFMGNAVVYSLNPEIYQEYIMFTLPLWTLIYTWAVPSLLTERDTAVKNERSSLSDLLCRLKLLLNPMFVAPVIGAIIGISGLGEALLALNGGKGIFVTQVVKTLGDCMSPIAMIITGITFAQIDIKKVLRKGSIYTVTVLRLLVLPLAIGGAAVLISNFIAPIPSVIFKCLIFSLSMPLGLNTIIIPASYGKDTSVPAGMALISHVLSLATIPLIVWIFM